MAYRIKSTFKVSLTSPDGGEAIFEFKPPLSTRLIDSLDSGKKPTPESIKEDWKKIAEDIVSIKDFEHEDGTPVTKEEIVGLALDFPTMHALVLAYNAHVAGLFAVNVEKKESKSE